MCKEKLLRYNSSSLLGNEFLRSPHADKTTSCCFDARKKLVEKIGATESGAVALDDFAADIAGRASASRCFSVRVPTEP